VIVLLEDRAFSAMADDRWPMAGLPRFDILKKLRGAPKLESFITVLNLQNAVARPSAIGHRPSISHERPSKQNCTFSKNQLQ
jgi:hypothetical protein